MMPSDLSPQARSLLDAAREGMSPDAAMLHRVRGKIDAAVVGGSATIASGMSIGAKLSILSLLALVIGGAGFLVRDRADHSAQLPALELAASSTVDLPSRRAHEAAPPAAAHIEMVADVRPPRTAAPPAGADLAREVELVDAAMAALRAGDANAAIQAVRLHRAETSDRGQLAEDAAAVEIEALCKLHDRRVVPKLEAFDRRWPDSGQRSRLSTTCF